jgi:hypothetical protein
MQKLKLLRLATGFYAGMAFIGLVLNRLLTGEYLSVPIELNWRSAGQVISASCFLMALVGLLTSLDLSFMRRIHEKLEGLKELIVSLTLTERVYLSVVAGFSEELFFRGVLQSSWGIVIVSFIFGALHAITLGYFLLATAIGFFLGWLLQYSGNLMAPMAVHALYDIFALTLLVRLYRSPRC